MANYHAETYIGVFCLTAMLTGQCSTYRNHTLSGKIDSTTILHLAEVITQAVYMAHYPLPVMHTARKDSGRFVALTTSLLMYHYIRHDLTYSRK